MTPNQVETLIQDALEQGEKSLDLSGKNITSLPESIGNLVKLELLYLYNNKLEALPKFLDSLVNLRDLRLHPL